MMNAKSEGPSRRGVIGGIVAALAVTAAVGAGTTATIIQDRDRAAHKKNPPRQSRSLEPMERDLITKSYQNWHDKADAALNQANLDYESSTLQQKTKIIEKFKTEAQRELKLINEAKIKDVDHYYLLTNIGITQNEQGSQILHKIFSHMDSLMSGLQLAALAQTTTAQTQQEKRDICDAFTQLTEAATPQSDTSGTSPKGISNNLAI